MHAYIPTSSRKFAGDIVPLENLLTIVTNPPNTTLTRAKAAPEPMAATVAPAIKTQSIKSEEENILYLVLDGGHRMTHRYH